VLVVVRGEGDAVTGRHDAIRRRQCKYNAQRKRGR